MDKLERIGLQDLQDLPKSFAHIKVINLKIAQPEEEQKLDTSSGFAVGASLHKNQDNMSNEVHRINARKTRQKLAKMQDTHGGKVTLDPIHLYDETTNDEWITTMRIAIATLDLTHESFAKILETSLTRDAKIAWYRMSIKVKHMFYKGGSYSEMIQEMANILKTHFLREMDILEDMMKRKERNIL